MAKSSSVQSAKPEHPLYPFRNVPAVIDDRIHAFACRAVMNGRIAFRPSLLLTQVEESLGGTDRDILLERLNMNCGVGKLLKSVIRVTCTVCGSPNEIAMQAKDIRQDANAVCIKCNAAFRLYGQQADEILVVNDIFADYIRVVSGKPPEYRYDGSGKVTT